MSHPHEIQMRKTLNDTHLDWLLRMWQIPSRNEFIVLFGRELLVQSVEAVIEVCVTCRVHFLQ